MVCCKKKIDNGIENEWKIKEVIVVISDKIIIFSSVTSASFFCWLAAGPSVVQVLQIPFWSFVSSMLTLQFENLTWFCGRFETLKQDTKNRSETLKIAMNVKFTLMWELYDFVAMTICQNKCLLLSKCFCYFDVDCLHTSLKLREADCHHLLGLQFSIHNFGTEDIPEYQWEHSFF